MSPRNVDWLVADNAWTQTILLVSSRMSELTSEADREAITARFEANLQPLAAIFAQGLEEGTFLPGEPLEHAIYFVSLMQGWCCSRCRAFRCRWTFGPNELSLYSDMI